MIDPSGVLRPTRRDVIRVLGAVVPVVGGGRSGEGSRRPRSGPVDSAVTGLYESLSHQQRAILCFPHDHPLRFRAEPSWSVVEPTIGAMSPTQRELCRTILTGITSAAGFGRLRRQMDEDAGGLEAYHAAFFGEPGTSLPFEWVITGRHVTLRADGHSAGGGVFAGPVFLGHDPSADRGDDRHRHNIWGYQQALATAIVRRLDRQERARACVAAGPRSSSSRPGILVGELGDSKQRGVCRLIDGLLSTFREADALLFLDRLGRSGGVDLLRLTLGATGRMDTTEAPRAWKLEGPTFSWSFHAVPHVHSRLDVAEDGPIGWAAVPGQECSTSSSVCWRRKPMVSPPPRNARPVSRAPEAR